MMPAEPIVVNRGEGGRRVKTLLFLLACTVAGAASQKIRPAHVPAPVRHALQRRFPGLRRIEWKVKSDNNYEAEFRLKGVEVAAKFDPAGSWLETESAISKADLPGAVRESVSQRFHGYRIVETQTVERPGGKPILYELHLDNRWELLKLQLDRGGKVVSKSGKPE